MTPGERFKSWLDGLFSTHITKPLAALLRKVLNLYLALPWIPPRVREDAAPYLASEDPADTITGIIFSLVGGISALLGVGKPISRKLEYYQDRLEQSFRLDPLSIIIAWRRDKAAYEKYFDDLKDQGWSDERIEALKFFTLFMPSARDIVSWYAREVYEPDMVDRYGLDSELPHYEETDFPKIGVDSTQAKNFWMAHWEHASYMQIREMVHRGVLSKSKEMPAPPTTKEGWAARDAEGAEAAYDWYRLVEIPPFWRARLTEMMFEVPTRVDVRRWWDMRTIDEERLRSIYHAQGYHGKDLEDYVLWTKVYVAFPDLIARWKNGWITLDDVRAELTGYGMPADRLEELIQTKITSAEPERTSTERDLTKTEIYKGVKKGLITWGEGLELLMDLGYDADEANYILEVNVGVLEGSPETFDEFKSLTKGWKKAAGMEAGPEVEGIKQAATEVVKLAKDLEILQARIKDEEAMLIKEEVLPAAATAKRDELRVTLHRAEAALAAAKSHYDALVAEWRHKA